MLEIRDYLRQVAKGELPMNHQIVYHLQDALNLLPDLDDAAKTKAFTTNTNDQLLVVYLSSLLRAVIALHALVDNKESIGKAELEEKEEQAGEPSKPGTKKEGKEVAEGETQESEKGL
jgi:26S proteasome regulatory subunit N8